jgi:Uri superfamily endonuclease
MGADAGRRSAGAAAPGRVAAQPRPGAYALLLALPEPRTLTVGRLGTSCFPAGFYLYLGSALGPGGLSSRLARHCRVKKKQHWHIDYLRSLACLEQIWVRITKERVECDWAAAAGALPGAGIPAPRFGASDCRCPAHLFHYPVRPDVNAFAASAGIDYHRLRVIPCGGNDLRELTMRGLLIREGAGRATRYRLAESGG